ncbi:CBL-interacting protein kinase 17 [Diplonema papillatum]|nr:CBL-interacting protein kinase 17 [Diplonema papillatum]|eukprot:gene8193-12631_t
MTPQATAQVEVPVRLGGYLLGATIGRGIGGKVKVAECCETGSLVAIKIQRKKGVDEAEARREAEVLRRLAQHSHAHLVNLHEVMESAKYLYTVLEYVPGGDLFDAVEKGRICEGTDRWVFKGIVDGLVALHASLVAHRDLKPENILCDLDRRIVKISDFGLSKLHVAEGELSTECVGTPKYAAPEIMSPSVEEYDAYRADIWSFGVTLYVALTRSFLPAEKLHFPDDLSHDACDLLTDILQPLPFRRPTLQQILSHDWFAGVSVNGDSGGSLIHEKPSQ